MTDTEKLIEKMDQRMAEMDRRMIETDRRMEKRVTRTEDLLSELVKQNLAIGQRIDETNRVLGQRIDETNRVLGQRIDETLKMMYEQRLDADKKHREAVELFYILREALERLPDVIKEKIGFELQPGRQG